MNKNGADLIVDTLIKNGVEYVFQLPGGKLGPLLMALKKREEIKVVTVRHEQNAGFMAQGIGRMTGKPGVVMTTSGPGALNLVTPLATATSDGDPVLAIAGQVPQAKLVTPYPQNPNISGVMNDSTITKYAKEIQHTDALADEVANAYVSSINGNPGAVFMDIPGNILLAETTNKRIIDIDTVVDHLDETYLPDTILLGNIAKNLKNITNSITDQAITDEWKMVVHDLQEKLTAKKKVPSQTTEDELHPLEIVDSLQKIIDAHPNTTVVMDGGSHEVWLGSYLKVYRPKHFLMSDGEQTLGVGLPWAISAALLRPEEKILSSGGDGSFMFSSQELATVAHYNLNIVQVIWVDKEYNMVEFQQELDYNGQKEGVDIDYIGYKEMAESYGIKAVRVRSKEALDAALKEAYATSEPRVIEMIEDNHENLHLRDKEPFKKY